MAEEVLKISIQAELREMQKSLATLPGITEREAKLMVAGLNRELRKAEAAAKRAAAASEKAWSKAGQGLKSALSSVGGQVGALGGQAVARPAVRPAHRGQAVGGGAALDLGHLRGPRVRVGPRAVSAAGEERAEQHGHEVRLLAEHPLRPRDGQVRVGRAEVEEQRRASHAAQL